MRIFYQLIFVLFLTVVSTLNIQAQSKSAADSLKREIMQLQLDVEHTQNNLRLYGKSFKRGIITSAIGYSIVITGGVLLGTENLSDWGQPLIFTGGVIGFGGAVLLFNSNRFILKAASPPVLPATQ